MKVALDEGVPEGLIEHLCGHDVHSVRQLGLKSVKNGQLLAFIERAQFDAFITNDKKMEAEGQFGRRSFAILILSATNWNVIKPHVGNIEHALNSAKPGAIVHVDVGRFVPVKRRYPRTP